MGAFLSLGCASSAPTVAFVPQGAIESFQGNRVVCVVPEAGVVSDQAAGYLIAALRSRGIEASLGCAGASWHTKLTLTASGTHVTTHGTVAGRYEATVTLLSAGSAIHPDTLVLIRPDGAYLEPEMAVLAKVIVHVFANGALPKKVRLLTPTARGV